ncbi:hypothetical protein D3C71_697340 [compost metagenome]
MVEEQAGIEVIEQVHLQQRVVLAYHEELITLLETAVLAAALATFARLHRHLFRRYAEHFARSGQQFITAAAHVVLGNRGRCGVLLHMQERAALAAILFVHVDGRCVFRQIGIVGAETGDAFARAPALELLQVLAQAVGHHLRAFAQLAHLCRIATRHRDRIADDQCTFQCTIEHLVLLARTQAGSEGQFVIAAQQAGAPLRHRLLQGIAELAVQRRIGGQALVIRRVADHRADLLLRGGQVGHIGAGEADGMGDAGNFRVLARRLDRHRVDVAAVDDRLQRSQAGRFAITRFALDGFPGGLVEAQPAARRQAAMAHQAGSDVGGHQRALDQQGAAAAHRIQQAATGSMQARPLRTHQQRGSQVFLQRRVMRSTTPATAMQRATTEVDRQRGAALAQRQVDAHVRQIGVDRRALEPFVTHAVDDGVLDPLRSKTGMGDLVAGHMRVHRQGHLRFDVFVPRQRAHAVIQRLLVRAFEFVDRPQHAAGQPRPHDDPQRLLQFAIGIDAGDGGSGLFQAEGRQLIGKQVFQALGAGDKKFHGIGSQVVRHGREPGHSEGRAVGTAGRPAPGAAGLPL